MSRSLIKVYYDLKSVMIVIKEFPLELSLILFPYLNCSNLNNLSQSFNKYVCVSARACMCQKIN